MESVNVPGTLYHLTTKDKWPDISQHGLSPQSASGEWKHIGYKQKTFLLEDIDEETIEELLAVMLGKHPEFDAWSEDQWKSFNESWIIITIDASKVPGLKLEIDPASPPFVQWYMTSTPIPASAFVDVKPAKP